MENNSSSSGGRPSSAVVLRSHSWRPPDDNLYKINCDAAVCSQGNRVGIGVIIGDSNGAVMLSASKTIEAGYSPSLAEAFAIHTGMQLAADSELLPAIVESYSLSVINLILAESPIRFKIGLII
ncbi:hypothetical protein JRO89_XS12G0242800 [Xanthoceras sorbifolium]|uniref:RNase H type-1 domain-containing protein n=1 Tax=Xanthoceras sorbifolium TaxID=99658 RepID=A0ABQ8HDP8_9ROSI|nr:hypothetical protein JRO89_XS12G0242800 [Xanthoceras sorbifolium]